MHGIAKMTGGGLIKKQLKYNKHGKIVSRKASRAAKKSKNLVKAGYITKKGQFGAAKKERDTMNGGFLKIPAYFTKEDIIQFKSMKEMWNITKLNQLSKILEFWRERIIAGLKKQKKKIKNKDKVSLMIQTTKIIKYFFLDSKSDYYLPSTYTPEYVSAFLKLNRPS